MEVLGEAEQWRWQALVVSEGLSWPACGAVSEGTFKVVLGEGGVWRCWSAGVEREHQRETRVVLTHLG